MPANKNDDAGNLGSWEDFVASMEKVAACGPKAVPWYLSCLRPLRDGVHQYDTEEEFEELPVLSMILPVRRFLPTIGSKDHFDSPEKVELSMEHEDDDDEDEEDDEAESDEAEAGASRIIWQWVE